MSEKHNLKELEESRYQAEVGYQASIPHHPYRKRAPKREIHGRLLNSKKGSRIRGRGSKSAARRKQTKSIL